MVTALLSTALLWCAGAAPLPAWTPDTHLEIARQAATIAPPDLFNQIKRHEKRFVAGLEGALSNARADHGRDDLMPQIAAGVRETIAAIEAHRPFRDIVYSLGRLSRFVADANNPLAQSAQDPHERRYARDYENYVRSAFARFPVVFYGEGRDVRDDRQLELLLAATGRRGRTLYPMIGREYRRVGKVDGVAEFDDRSTAFGVGSVSFSHAVSDIAALYRYIWLGAGGADRRELPITPPQPTDRAQASR